MRNFILLLMGLLLLTGTAYGAKKTKNMKLGLNRFNSDINYLYETQRFADETSETAEEPVMETYTGTMIATDLMFEWIMFGVVGFEVDIGTTPSRQNFTFLTRSLDDQDTKIGDVVQTVQTGVLSGLNMYFGNHESGGWKPFFGVLTGTYLSTQAFSNGGERDDDQYDTLTGFRSNQSSTITIPAQVLKIGVDWILENVGMRFQFLSITAEATSSSLPTTRNNQVQHEAVSLTGGFSIAVFAHW
ncbi:MAG: hypothetical protein HQM12_05165 [SAR324 cluster bacterium]|nr:hypothetical protein [SAR324 cluster bacterium]